MALNKDQKDLLRKWICSTPGVLKPDMLREIAEKSDKEVISMLELYKTQLKDKLKKQAEAIQNEIKNLS